MSKVWTATPVSAKLDVASALPFGKITTINQKYVFADKLEPDGSLPSQIASNLAKAADEFDPEADHLLLIGDHVQLTAFAALLAKRHSFFRVLRFDREANGYVSIRLDY